MNYIQRAITPNRSYHPYEMIPYINNDSAAQLACRKPLCMVDEAYNSYLTYIDKNNTFKQAVKQQHNRIKQLFSVYFLKVENTLGKDKFVDIMDTMDDVQESLRKDLFIHKQSLHRALVDQRDDELRRLLTELLYCDHVIYIARSFADRCLKAKEDDKLVALNNALRQLAALLIQRQDQEITPRAKEQIDLSISILATNLCRYESH